MGKIVATASVTVQSDESSADYDISVEVMKKIGDKYVGNSSFKPGDTAYFALYKPSEVSISQVISTWGSVVPAGSYTSTEIEVLSFTELNLDADTEDKEVYNEASVNKPIDSYDFHWYTSAINVQLLDNKKTFRSQEFQIAIAKCQFKTTATMYSLQLPAVIPADPFLKAGEQAEYPIQVVFVGLPPLP